MCRVDRKRAAVTLGHVLYLLYSHSGVCYTFRSHTQTSGIHFVSTLKHVLYILYSRSNMCHICKHVLYISYSPSKTCYTFCISPCPHKVLTRLNSIVEYYCMHVCISRVCSFARDVTVNAHPQAVRQKKMRPYHPGTSPGGTSTKKTMGSCLLGTRPQVVRPRNYGVVPPGDAPPGGTSKKL